MQGPWTPVWRWLGAVPRAQRSAQENTQPDEMPAWVEGEHGLAPDDKIDREITDGYKITQELQKRGPSPISSLPVTQSVNVCPEHQQILHRNRF